MHVNTAQIGKSPVKRQMYQTPEYITTVHQTFKLSISKHTEAGFVNMTDTRCPMSQHRTIKDVGEKNWSHGWNHMTLISFISHNLACMSRTGIKVNVLVHLLYGAVASDSV